ncbi:hypothetical protein IF2G_02666 [Cordyceps javanica]|nr:hypothetical protein IF2G_02666 [Cordyceps javanica]
MICEFVPCCQSPHRNPILPTNHHERGRSSPCFISPSEKTFSWCHFPSPHEVSS